jgi:serine/threonine protein kinase
MGNCSCRSPGKNIDNNEKHIDTPENQAMPNLLAATAASLISMQGRGQFMDHYQLGAFLGNDALSELRICHKVEDANGPHYIVKVVSKDKLNKLEQQFFKVELSVLKQLKHPNLAQIIDIFEDERCFFVVSEYYDHAITFQGYLQSKGGQLKEKEAAQIVRQILETVQYCHSQGIVLRNLNPDSIVLCNTKGSSDRQR